MNRNKKDSAGAFRQKAVVVAVAVVCANMAYADEWKPNAEVFVKPGSERGLAGVDALIPLRQDADSLFFADVKAHLDTQSANEFNLGLGYRSMLSNSDWALGVYGAWDRRHSRNGNDFDQGTIGIEGRSSVMDLRANYYHPFTDKKLIDWSNQIQFSGFGVYRKGYYEEAMRGYDAEVGVLVPVSDTVETRVYVAGYHFDGQDVAPDTNGARLRLEVRPQQNLIVGLSHQHDSLFGSVTFAELRYAFGMPSTSGIRKIRQRMTDPWVRDIDVKISPVLLSHRPEDGQTLLDPLTGKPIQAVHIDSTRGNDGYAGSDIGSYEHPYASADGCYGGKCELTVGETNVGRYDTIYLWQGNSLTTPYTTAMRGAVFQLLDGQKLWGEGYNPLTGAVNPAKRPVIDGGEGGSSYGADGIRLASNATIGNMVVGLDIQNTPNGIIGDNTGGMVAIHDVGMTNVYRGIVLTNDVSGAAAMGPVAVAESSGFTQTVDIHDVNISSSDDAIHLHNRSDYGGGILQTVSIRDSVLSSAYGNGISMQNEAGGGAYYGPSTSPGSITQTATISGNTITAYGDGVGAENSAWGGDGAEGVYAGGGSVTQHLTVTGNTINAGNDGIYVASHAYGGGAYGDGGSVSQTTVVSGNTINATYDGVSLVNNAFGTDSYYGSAGHVDQTVTISGNTITSSYGDGIYLANTTHYGYYGSGSITQSATISGNTITATTGDGIYVDNHTSGGGQIDQGGGMATSVYGGGVTGLTIADNTITAGYHGIHLYNDAYNGGHISQSATLSNNTIASTGNAAPYGGGVVIENYATGNKYSIPSITQTVSISGGTISTVYGAGIDVTNGAGNGGSVSQGLDVYGVGISSAYGDGIAVRNGTLRTGSSAGYGGYVTQTLSVANSTITASGAGIGLENDSAYGGGSSYGGTIDQTATISGNSIMATEGPGVYGANRSAYGGSITQTIGITGNTITSSGAPGVALENAAYMGASSTQTATITDNTITGMSNGVGLLNGAKYGATATQTVTLTGNLVTANGGMMPAGPIGKYNGAVAGFNVATNNGGAATSATQTVSLSDNTLNSAYGAGVAGWNMGASPAVTSVANATQTFTLSDGAHSGAVGGAGNGYGGNVINADIGLAFNNGAPVSAGPTSYGGVMDQTVTVTGQNTINSTGVGAEFRNDAWTPNVTANQTVTLTGATINAGGWAGVALNNSSASGSGGYGGAVQHATLSGNVVNLADGGEGVFASNEAHNYYGGAIADQTVTLTNNQLNVPGASGADFYNTAYNSSSYGGSASATQTVSMTGNQIAGDPAMTSTAGNGARFYNNADLGTSYGGSTATQTVTFSDNSVKADNTGVTFQNQAANYGYDDTATAGQTVTAMDHNTISASTGVTFSNNANSSYGTASATQDLQSFKNNTITSSYGGVLFTNAATVSGDYATANATQTAGVGATFSGNTISATVSGPAVSFTNTATNSSGWYYASASATQVGHVTDNTLTANGGAGVVYTNNAQGADYGGATATQTGSVAGGTISAYGHGVSLSNTASSGYYYDATATQTVTVAGVTSLTSSSGYAVNADQNASSGSVQTVNVIANALSSPNANPTGKCNQGGTQNVSTSGNNDDGVTDTCAP